ncbi:MAG: DUF4174 domain-containing protein [Epibacterium sp.]|nr:DUF4174 domain-containing protein [Epibacterium sp.]
MTQFLIRQAAPFAALAFGLMQAVSLPACAQETTENAVEAAQAAPTVEVLQGYDVQLDSFQWTHRPVVIFADSPNDPRFQEQIDKLLEDPGALFDRDVVVLIDSDPARKSALRKRLRPRGFMMVLIGKDGGVKLRKPLPWSVREISRSIDKMPMRLREVEERRAG